MATHQVGFVQPLLGDGGRKQSGREGVKDGGKRRRLSRDGYVHNPVNLQLLPFRLLPGHKLLECQ